MSLGSQRQWSIRSLQTGDMGNYTELINYLGKQMSQGNMSVSERLLWRKETLKNQPEKLGGESAGVGGDGRWGEMVVGDWLGEGRGNSPCKGQRARWGGALGAGESRAYEERDAQGSSPFAQASS